MKKVVFLFIVCLGMFPSNIFSKDYIIDKSGKNISCDAITGEDELNIYFDFYTGVQEVNTFIKKTEVKEYNFSNRDKFLKKQKQDAEKKEIEQKKLNAKLEEQREKDSLSVVNTNMLTLKKQKEENSLDTKKEPQKVEEKKELQNPTIVQTEKDGSTQQRQVVIERTPGFW